MSNSTEKSKEKSSKYTDKNFKKLSESLRRNLVRRKKTTGQKEERSNEKT